MSINSWLAHRAIQIYQKPSHDKFCEGLINVEKTQRDKLGITLDYLKPYLMISDRDKSYENFKTKFAVTSYKEYQGSFLNLKQGLKDNFPPIVRFQPTSGSTNSIKWIPYTEELVKDFDRALGPWLYDLYRQHPEVVQGPHYWSLSWLPEDLRQEGVRLNDIELFPFWKRQLLKYTMAINAPVDLATTSESSLFATATLLVAQKNLSFISVWSPTFWTTLINILETYRNEISQSLILGQWEAFKKELTSVKCPQEKARGSLLRQTIDPKRLWPRLKTLSCWTTSTSRYFAQSIKNQYEHLNILGKGLWSTEAVVTIPFQNKYVLASQSHFFEFQDVHDGKIIPAWELKMGQQVQPIITSSGGLIRYKMDDILEVDNFIHSTPCLQFLGRSDGVDMVGEKISSVQSEKILQDLTSKINAKECYLFAVKGQNRSRYCAVISTNHDVDSQSLSNELELLLQKSFHYKLARELKQLNEADVLIHRNAYEGYLKLHLKRGMVLGNIKNEALRLISEEELQENFK